MPEIFRLITLLGLTRRRSMEKLSILILILQFVAVSAFSEEIEYRPGGEKYEETWTHFYNGDHESELDDPLIEAGKEMVLVICEAIEHRDMRLRRYAIGALGYIGDVKALPALEKILKSDGEVYYFRGDALRAIYQIDKNLGKKYAKKYAKKHEYLADLQVHIEKDSKWLTEPTNH